MAQDRDKLTEAKRLWAEIKSDFRVLKPVRVAVTGDGQGTARKNLFWERNESYKWVREQSDPEGKPFPVLDRGKAGNFFNLPVLIGYDDYNDPQQEQILGIHWDSIPGGISGGGSVPYSLPAHHWTHEFNGGDTLFIDNRVFTPGLVTPLDPVSMQVYIQPFNFFYNVWNRYPGGSSEDLSQFKPSGNTNRYVTIVHNPVSNEIEYIQGPNTGDTSLSSILGNATFSTSGIPSPSSFQTPLGAVFLSSATSILDWTNTSNIVDTRPLIGPSVRDILNRLDNIETEITVGAGATLPHRGVQEAPDSYTTLNAGYLRGDLINPNISPAASEVLKWDGDNRWWTSGSVAGGAGNGDVGSANNLGAGSAVWKEKSGASLLFRTLLSGDGINLDYTDASHLRITASDITAKVGSANNLGTGSAIWKEKSGASLTFRTILPGTGVNLDYTDASHLRITASAGGGTSSLDDSPALKTLFVQTTSKAIQNSTTSGTLFGQGRGSKFIPASTLDEGVSLKFQLFGKITDTSATPAPSIAIQLHNTTLASINPTLGDVTAGAKWVFDGTIICQSSGTSGTVQTFGSFEYNNGTILDMLFTEPVTVNTIEEAELKTVWTWDVADTANSVSSLGATIEKMSVFGLAPVGVTELSGTAA